MFGTRQKKLALLLGATAAGWSMGAAADIDFQAATDDPAVIQLESEILSTGTDVADDGGDLVVVTEIGAGFSVDQKIYVRFDLVNGVLAGDLANTALSSGAILGDVVISQGGDEDDSWVIFTATVDEVLGIDQDAILQFDLDTVGVTVDDQNEVSIIYGLYESLSAAANANTAVVELGPEPAITFAQGIAVTFDATTVLAGNDAASTPVTGALVAEVENDFLDFGADDANGGVHETVKVGELNFAASGAREPAGGAEGLDAYDISNITVSGDFNLVLDTVADADDVYTLGNVFIQNGRCQNEANRVSAEIEATSVTADTAVFDVDLQEFDPTGGDFSICLTSFGENEILEATYAATFDGVTLDTDDAPLTGATATLGSITRNGVVVQLPYLTDFEDYNQRIVIVNRNATDVEIAGITYLPETGTTVTDTMTADDMTIPANGMKVLLVRDILDTDGMTRTAATLSIVAKNGTIDVATQQVNLTDGTTDTAEYTDN